MTDLNNELDNILDLRRRLYRALDSGREVRPAPAAVFTPPLDVVKLPDAVVITVELPGLRREEVDVELEGSLLTISGERQASEGDSVLRRERPSGAFKRSLSLPGVSEQDVSASLKDGVLTVRVKRAG